MDQKSSGANKALNNPPPTPVNNPRQLSIRSHELVSSRRGVQQIVMAGKVDKTFLYTPWLIFRLWPDWRTIRFLYYHAPMYRPEAAMDAWEKAASFFGRHLSA